MCKNSKEFFLAGCVLSKDVLDVGLQKPVGYLNLRFLKNWRDEDLDALQKTLQEKGLKTLLLKGAACAMRAGALYAYHEQALGEILRARAEILIAQGWPVEPEAFVRKLALDWAPEKTALFDTIADTFNNKAHPGRTDVPAPESDAHFSPEYLAYLRRREKGDHVGPRCPPP